MEGLLIKEGFTCEDRCPYFSSIVPNGVCNVWKKDGLEIVYGLGEAGFPPTLLYPIPYTIKPIEEDGTMLYRMITHGEVLGLVSKDEDKVYNDILEYHRTGKKIELDL